MKHTSIRGLSPQAGGFRRRSNTETGIEPSDFLERLPCGQHVVTRPPAALIIPQRATDLKPRIKDSCLNTTHITNTELTEGDWGCEALFRAFSVFRGQNLREGFTS